MRSGTFQGKARNQLQVAVSSDGSAWFLVNASPDLRVQIEANAFLHPRDGIRQSPVSGIVLTSADLDQALGLLLMRELQPLQVYCTASIRNIIREDNSMFGMLQRMPKQTQWQDIVPGSAFALVSSEGKPSGIQCTGISLDTHYPAYVGSDRAATLSPNEALLGLILQSREGRRLGYFPAVPALDDALIDRFEGLDLLLFDGTFWRDDELIRIQGGGQTARQMGHVPVSSKQGSLHLLAGLKHPRKVFVHINNTNPMLNESGPEYQQVREAGWEVAEDGWRFEL